MPMTALEPSKARAFWFALVDNAARLVVDADTLGAASPRAQSLVVLALEELGKAQWKEMIEDPLQKIGRPRQIYTGAPARDYTAISTR